MFCHMKRKIASFCYQKKIGKELNKIACSLIEIQKLLGIK